MYLAIYQQVMAGKEKVQNSSNSETAHNICRMKYYANELQYGTTTKMYNTI